MLPHRGVDTGTGSLTGTGWALSRHPAGALALARESLTKREKRLEELNAKIAEKVDRLEVAKTEDEERRIGKVIGELRNQQKSVVKQIKELYDRIERLGERRRCAYGHLT